MNKNKQTHCTPLWPMYTNHRTHSGWTAIWLRSSSSTCSCPPRSWRGSSTGRRPGCWWKLTTAATIWWQTKIKCEHLPKTLHASQQHCLSAVVWFVETLLEPDEVHLKDDFLGHVNLDNAARVKKAVFHGKQHSYRLKLSMLIMQRIKWLIKMETVTTAEDAAEA